MIASHDSCLDDVSTETQWRLNLDFSVQPLCSLWLLYLGFL